MTALAALIVDDEPLARAAIRLALSRDREVHVVAECANGNEALEVLAREPIALLFLDVRMPGLDGLEALGRLTAPPATVLVSAFADHALTAFDLDVVDYVLKPFDDHRFLRAVERAKRHARARLAPPPGPRPRDAAPRPAHPGATLERLVIRNGARIATLALADVDWIEAQDYYAEVHAGGRTYLVRRSLHDLAAALDPDRFVRIHRKTIVNIQRVKELEPVCHGEYLVFLHDGTRLKLSRTFKSHLGRLLGLP
ncbi:MAG TPA: LytTR family DNA-binding domain-containing protein [Kofleriaceae bacterium]|nr:LytTR family DNA-binding domain-containing protein [Kofleriaceae bacterium]